MDRQRGLREDKPRGFLLALLKRKQRLRFSLTLCPIPPRAPGSACVATRFFLLCRTRSRHVNGCDFALHPIAAVTLRLRAQPDVGATRKGRPSVTRASSRGLASRCVGTREGRRQLKWLLSILVCRQQAGDELQLDTCKICAVAIRACLGALQVCAEIRRGSAKGSGVGRCASFKLV